MQHFKFYASEDILSLTNNRSLETKLGQACHKIPQHAEWPQCLQHSAIKFVVIGIPEDIGVKANGGVGGTDSIWVPFLKQFLNIQSNDYLTGENVLVLGHFDFGDIKYLIENNASSENEKMEAYRHAVDTIDDEVEHLIKIIIAAEKIPIVIGGGHNNSYPIIKAAAKGLHQLKFTPLAQINCLNLDAHTDFRSMEGRHSGNGFRYAEHDGYLGKYSIVGVHENYVPQTVLMEINANPFVQLCTYEDIFLKEKLSFIQATEHATGFTSDTYTGVEIDLDAVSHTLSSAASPCGVSEIQARQFLQIATQESMVAYLHICEGATQLNDGQKKDSTAKLISYLVSDFIKIFRRG